MKDLYKNRFLSQGYPDLEKKGVSYKWSTTPEQTRIPIILRCLGRLVDLPQGIRTITVIGCGPKPLAINELIKNGYKVVGIEPLASSAAKAAEFLGDPSLIRMGSAEELPLSSNSQRIVLCENVLEHVDSPQKTLAEAYRVLVPGGILYIYTTNRLKFSLTGRNDEFRKRFYNWYPAVLRECFVFHHLHYDPRLANFSPRPAVHWFTYARLCQLGRQSGFSHFYSLLDLIEPDDPDVKMGLLRRWLFRKGRYNPWIRAIALSQGGSSIFMLKRTLEV